MSTIHELRNTIDVETPLGYGKAIAWLDYGTQTNTVWKVVLYDSGKVRNFYDDDIKVYPNKMDGGNPLQPETVKGLERMKAEIEATSPYNDGWTQEAYKQELNEGHKLELMDRLHVGMTQLNDFVAEHPLLSEIESARSSVNVALENLASAYQQVGNYEPQEENKTKLYSRMDVIGQNGNEGTHYEEDWMDEKYREEYEGALKSGMFFEWYPNLSGVWDHDKYAYSWQREKEIWKDFK